MNAVLETAIRALSVIAEELAVYEFIVRISASWNRNVDARTL